MSHLDTFDVSFRHHYHPIKSHFTDVLCHTLTPDINNATIKASHTLLPYIHTYQHTYSVIYIADFRHYNAVGFKEENVNTSRLSLYPDYINYFAIAGILK